MQGGVGISVAGGLSFGVAYLLDGAMHNNPQDNLNLPLPFPDALQEFSVATERAVGAERHALGRVGERGDEVGHQHASRQRVRVPARQAIQRHRSVCPIGPDGKRRDDGLQRNQFGGTLGGPMLRDRLFFFGAIPGHGRPSDAGGEHRVRADGGDAGRRLHGVRVAGLQRGPAGRAARAVRQQPDRSGAVQPGGA